MSFRINTNVAAMTAHRNANQTNFNLGRNLEKLSSGLRINRAADDAAGLAIANSLRAQASGLGQAIRNGNDGIALVQTADGALEESGNLLNRLRDLSVQASNDGQDSTTRGYIKTEMDALVVQIEAIADTTSYNGINLLDASGGASTDGVFSFHTGAYANETTSVTIGDAQTAALGVDGLDSSTQAGAEADIATIDAAIKTLDGIRGTIGAGQNALESTIRNISVTRVNVEAAESNIRDVDFAAESASFTRNNILAQSGAYALSQANAVQQNVLSLLR